MIIKVGHIQTHAQKHRERESYYIGKLETVRNKRQSCDLKENEFEHIAQRKGDYSRRRDQGKKMRALPEIFCVCSKFEIYMRLSAEERRVRDEMYS